MSNVATQDSFDTAPPVRSRALHRSSRFAEADEIGIVHASIHPPMTEEAQVRAEGVETKQPEAWCRYRWPAHDRFPGPVP